MKNSRPSQCDRVLKHLKERGTITQDQARSEHGVSRLSSRINELKSKRQIPIITRMIDVPCGAGEKTRVAEYKLGKLGQQEMFHNGE